MSTTPIGDAAAADTAAPRGDVFTPAPGRELAVLTPAEVTDLLGAHRLPVKAWLAALAEQEAFEETDAEDASLSILRAIMTAETPAAAFAAMQALSVKDLLGDEPGARTNVYELRGATPLASTFEDGPSCFAVIDAFDLAEQVPVTLTCGGRAVQAFCLAAEVRGWLPVKVVFTRRRKPTRKGYYPVNIEAGI